MSHKEEEWGDRLKLVNWEHSYPRKTFDLTTIRSLLVDPLPKFQQLKQIITNFNTTTDPARIRYQQTYIEHLFKMLSELTRLPTLQQQLQQLDKLHYWATRGAGAANLDQDAAGSGGNNGKNRPGTASTRTRPTTAYSRPQTGLSRPQTGLSRPGTAARSKEEPVQMKKDDPRIDYDKLKEGEMEFYSGARTIHPELPHPRKRLKEYERVKLAQDNEVESDLEIIQLQEKPVLKEIEVCEEKLMEELQDGQLLDGGQGVEGEGGEPGEGDLNDLNQANVDDIPIEGEEEGGAPEPEEEVQVIDKLRPKLKAYGEPVKSKISKTHLQGGINELQRQQYYRERKLEEDKDLAQLEVMWAQGKSRAKSEMKRRAESARIVTKMIGVPMKKEIVKRDLENVISFQNIVPVEVAPKLTRPTTAFTSDRAKMRQELISKAFLHGKLSSHINVPQFIEDNKPEQREVRALTAVGAKPKRRCFEDILREAEERVVREAEEQVTGVKNSLAKGGVGVGTNKIARSITFEERELPGEWGGIVTGMGMIKNPFIKIAKKKKKKKKK